MKKYSLYLLVSIVLIVFVFFSFLSIYFTLRGNKTELIQTAIKEKLHLAETINETLASPIWVYRLALVPGMERAFIEEMARFSEVEYVKIVSMDGIIIESSLEEERGKSVKTSEIYAVSKSRKEIIKDEVFEGDEIKLIIYPGYSDKTIWIGFTLNEVEKIIREMWIRDILFLGISILIIFLILFLVLRKSIIFPLTQMIQLCEKVRKGDLRAQVKIKSKTEIGQLAAAFNRMIKDLSKYHVALEESKNVLEVRVRARTKELEELSERQEDTIQEKTKQLRKRVNELERFYKLTVGRELKMIELKKEINKIKQELKNKKPKNKK
jgi:methyl-accepting chemotaxis protein